MSAAQDGVQPPVDDQLAKALWAPVDYRPRQRVEPLDRDDHLVRLAGRGLSEPDRRVLGVGETSDRADVGGERGGGAQHGVGRRQVALAHRLMDDHQVPGDVAGCEDVRCACAQLGVHLHIAALVGVHARGGEIELGGVRGPADRDNRKRRLDELLRPGLFPGHAYPRRAGLEPIDDAGFDENLDPGRIETRADRGGDVLILAQQEPGCGVEQGHA